MHVDPMVLAARAESSRTPSWAWSLQDCTGKPWEIGSDALLHTSLEAGVLLRAEQCPQT